MDLKKLLFILVGFLCVSNLVMFYVQSNFGKITQDGPFFGTPLESDDDALFTNTSEPEPIAKIDSKILLDLKKNDSIAVIDDAQTRGFKDLAKEESLSKNEKISAVEDVPEDTTQDEKESVKNVTTGNYTAPKGRNQSRIAVALAANPYRLLNVYEPMPHSYLNAGAQAKFYNKTRYYGIKKNPHYCEMIDLFNLKHPQNVFGPMKFVSDYAGEESLVRKSVMPKFGPDVLPKVRATMPLANYVKPLFDLPFNATTYFFKRVNVHHYYGVGQQIACLSQMYNHIPGHGVLTRKDLVVDSLKEYIQENQNRPECIKEDLYFPLAYRLNNYAECKQFFSEVESKEFQDRKAAEPLQYIIKVGYGAHRAAGLALFDEKQEELLRDKYADGAMCGTIKQSLVAQKYISNPLLLDKKNKFDFRIYMLVASVDPMIVYYHDGFLRISLSAYDKNSKMKNVHFTNTHLSKSIFAKAKEDEAYEGMTEKELRDYQMWTMEDLQDYLIKIGKIKDNTWLEKELRPKFQAAYTHLVRMTEKSFYKSASVFELYGLDFVIDENLDIWFIECNASPQLVGTSPRKTEFLTKMLSDMFTLQHAYYKSRMRRVFAFMTDLQAKIKEDPTSINKEELQKEFSKVNTNKLDPEFPVNEDNGFVLIMDKNLEGPAAYFGHLNEACLAN